MTTSDTSIRSTSTGGRGLPQQTRRRLPFAVAVVGSLLIGAVAAAVLVLVVAAGATEPVITGAGLVGFGAGWAMVAFATTRWTSQPQRWAVVPAAVLAATGIGLVVTRPDNGALTAAGWVWPPAALVLAVWMARAVRRDVGGRSGWLLYPAVAVVAVVAVAGAVETAALARDESRGAMPGVSYVVEGHRLHLVCVGTGSPTVVLENGLAEPAALWDGVMTQVSATTRVCAYDRPGQGFSDDLSHRQDGREVAADLHGLLARGGERGPYVLAGHSSGGTLALTYAARYPDQVAGLVLLDSSSPDQVQLQPDFARTFALMRRALPVLPAMNRLGLMRLSPASPATALSPEAARQVRAFATSPRGARNMAAEQAQLRIVFRQAQALTGLGAKPLAVVTAGSNADGTRGWATSQDRLAALSTNSVHWTADTTHVGLLDDTAGAAHSVRAVTAVVTAVRSGSPVDGSAS
jgi:pimeloyl-ACP methyl ester carboxylesterase